MLRHLFAFCFSGFITLIAMTKPMCRSKFNNRCMMILPFLLLGHQQSTPNMLALTWPTKRLILKCNGNSMIMPISLIMTATRNLTKIHVNATQNMSYMKTKQRTITNGCLHSAKILGISSPYGSTWPSSGTASRDTNNL